MIEVTDEILMLACKVYGIDINDTDNANDMKATLEAVFKHIEKEPKISDLDYNKQYANSDDKIFVRDGGVVMSMAEYAEKQSADNAQCVCKVPFFNPAGRDYMGEFTCTKCNGKVPQPEHIEPDNDGWIESKGDRPSISDDIEIEVRLESDSEQLKGKPSSFMWHWRGNCGEYAEYRDIIAYRIIKEDTPDKEKCCSPKKRSKYCECLGMHSIRTAHNGQNICNICDRVSTLFPDEEEAKEKVPTFEGFVTKRMTEGAIAWSAVTPYYMHRLVSEYAEKYLVTK